VIVLRDLVCLAVGVWGVVHEELSSKPDLGRLAFFSVLMVAPGVLATVWLAAQSGIGGQSSPPQVEPSPSPSPSNSPGA
jgi:hypothetical protein